MKKVKLIIVLTLITFISAAQSFYYYKGEKIPLSISNKKIIAKFSAGLIFEQKKQVIATDFTLKQLEESKPEALPNVSCSFLRVAKSKTACGNQKHVPQNHDALIWNLTNIFFQL